MKTMKHFLFTSLALVLLLFCAAPANAQGLSGKFYLPFVAEWGKAVLPPGDYGFHMDRLNGILYIESGSAIVGMVLPASVDPSSAVDSQLVVTSSGGVKSVSELTLADAGKILRFHGGEPANHKVQLATMRYLIQVVPRAE